MATEVKLPRLGQGMETGTILRWIRSEGDHVEQGEPLYELDTDKVTQEVEADVSGFLLQVVVPAGEVEVGRTVAYIGREGESAPAGRSASASPRARRLARELGLDLAAVTGSGPGARIVAGDVQRASATAERPAAPAIAAEEARPLTTVRRTIARRLTEAWQAPAFQLSRSVDMTRSQALRVRRRELEPGVHLTLTDVLTKFCAVALVRHPEVNVQYADDALLFQHSANIGIAVAAPAGLVVPVVKRAEHMSLDEIAVVRAGLVERARAGGLEQDDLEGGTFTISNLGMFGVEQFIAVLNPPQAAILAVGATEDKVVARNGVPVVRPTMTMTLTVDHRAIDGAAAAGYLQTVTRLLEEPDLAL
jgi:pyruvate dehydrogenase E2 component (dihydrolipoamide acetyltransferase)